MNDDAEWIVYEGVKSAYILATSAEAWDEFVRDETKHGREVNLTLLARGLTKKQALAMARLTEDDK